MPTFTSRRRYRAFPKRRARARAAFLLGVALAGSLIAARAAAGPGSGDATLFGPNPVTAGQADEWTLQYRATEAFAPGATIEVEIPPSWSAPQDVDAGAPGYFQVGGDPTIDNVAVVGQTIRLFLAPPFANDSYLWVYYGIGGGGASAHAQTNAQDSVFFQVRSDPQATGTVAPLASSPFLSVIADPVVASVDVVDAANLTVDTLARTTDQDTTHLFLRGYDAYGNPSRLIAADWTLSGGVGAPVPLNGTSTALRLDVPGIGMARAFETDVRAALAGESAAGVGPRAGFFAWVDGAPADGYRAPRVDEASHPAGRRRAQAGRVSIVTGQYGEQVLSPLLPLLRTATETPVRLVPVRNSFFGGNIAVTGLLTGRDVRDALASEPPGERYLLPDVVLSRDRFLDGMAVADLPRPVEVVPTDGASLVDSLR